MACFRQQINPDRSSEEKEKRWRRIRIGTRKCCLHLLEHNDRAWREVGEHNLLVLCQVAYAGLSNWNVA